jgi:hypothetical protein
LLQLLFSTLAYMYSFTVLRKPIFFSLFNQKEGTLSLHQLVSSNSLTRTKKDLKRS